MFLGSAACYESPMLRYLLFDLDNTLYSGEYGMEQDIQDRMNGFVARYFDLSVPEARELRHERARRYGTTLEWLMAEEGLTDPERYFAVVHPEGEEYCIPADPNLGVLLDALPLPKAVFTNSPSEHAARVLRKLGVGDRFESVYDIRFCAMKGKPHAEAFRRVCAACGLAPEDILFVDDMPKYVRGFVELGGRGIVLDERGFHAASGLPSIRSLGELSAILSEDAAGGAQLTRPL